VRDARQLAQPYGMGDVGFDLLLLDRELR